MTPLLRGARLFLGSYALLFLLRALRFRSGWLELACLALSVFGFADMAWIVFGVSRRTGAEPIRVAQASDAGPEVAGYVATYLLPFEVGGVVVASPSDTARAVSWPRAENDWVWWRWRGTGRPLSELRKKR